jgi:hypothetical protein
LMGFSVAPPERAQGQTPMTPNSEALAVPSKV